MPAARKTVIQEGLRQFIFDAGIFQLSHHSKQHEAAYVQWQIERESSSRNFVCGIDRSDLL